MAKGAITLKVHLVPRAARDEIVGLHGDAIKVKVKAPPVKGKANEALQSFIAEKLQIPPSRVEIIAGQLGREKLLRINGVSRVEVEKGLGIILPVK